MLGGAQADRARAGDHHLVGPPGLAAVDVANAGLHSPGRWGSGIQIGIDGVSTSFAILRPGRTGALPNQTSAPPLP